MNINYKARLQDNFPKELTNLAQSLENIGISGMAWNLENPIKVINFLNENNYLILGGDVYKMIDGELNSTYDSWYFDKDKSKSSQELLHESRNRAIEYIKKYHEMNGQDYYYSIVFILSK